MFLDIIEKIMQKRLIGMENLIFFKKDLKKMKK